MSKESVTLPSAIPSVGIDEIIVIVGRVTGIYLTSDLLGGRERVNRNGKLAKRIKRNLKRELGIDLDNNALTAIGNAVNRHSLKDEIYLVEYTDDLLSIVGKFSDDDSCFQEGHQNYHHLLAMNDPDANIAAFCVYRSDGRNIGRAWCFNAEDGAHVYFNAYGLHLDKIGKLASVLHNKPLREGYIRTDQDIWLNRGGLAYIVGGDSGKNNYLAELKRPDEYAPHQCTNCNRPIWDDNVYTVPNQIDGEEEEWCHSCYHRHFWDCERCHGQYRHDSDQMQRVHGSREYDRVCLTCAQLHYHQCDHCQKEGNTNWYMQGRLYDYTTREGNELHLCRDHHQRHVVCFECGNMIEPGTALAAYVNRYETRRACTQCVHDSNRIQYCTRCNDLTVDRFSEQCRRCGGRDVSPVIALIVQENDEAHAETDPADLVTDNVTVSDQTITYANVSNGTVWITMDGGETIAATGQVDDRPAAMQNELDELLAELNEQLEPNNAPGPDPEPDNEPDPENLEGEVLIFADGTIYQTGCMCVSCAAETTRRIAAGILPPLGDDGIPVGF